MKRRQLVIIAAFCVSFVSMVALALFSMARFATFTRFSDDVDHTHSVIINIRSAEVSLRDVGLTERGYMITHDTMYLRFLNNSIDSINKCVDTLGKITADNPDQKKNVTMLRASVAIRIAAVRANIDYVDTSKSAAPSKFYFDSRQQMIECSRQLRAMRITENALLAERYKSEQFYQALTTSTLRYLLAVFCIMTLLLFAILIKELRERVRYQEELQAKVIDLGRSHKELQEIAFAASHDLQEPLRKIQVFSNMLIYKSSNQISDEYKGMLERINASATRMQLLISDLNALTSLTKIDAEKEPVDLNVMCQYLLYELEEKVQEKGASVELLRMPIIKGYSSQLKILFKALFDNSLKFTRDGVKPVITLSFEIVNGHALSGINPNLQHKKFYCITCSDNGIGFDNQFITKIFEIFQRLHTQQSSYEGKGIGLAICQRIMANHEGYIIAHGEPKMGAKFKLFFPLED